MPEPRIVLLAGPGPLTELLAVGLEAEPGLVAVVLEEAASRRAFLRRRISRLGLPAVIGQLLFRALVVPILERRSAARVRAILDASGIGELQLPEGRTHRVPSANEASTIELIEDLRPDLIVVNGTRLLSAAFLQAVSAPVVNVHTGITPAYRGVHGGYWALAERESELCGVTVHLVDEGIDTGSVLAQTTIEPTAADNFVTYPYLQLCAALPLLRALSADLPPAPVPPRTQRSALWTHPTLWDYVGRRIRHGVR